MAHPTDYWHDAARAAKRALLGTGEVRLCGDVFRMAYETRGVREDRDYPVLRALARNRRGIFDVGANLGVTALLTASVLHPEGRLWAFEASEDACRVVRRNLALNGLDGRAEVVNAVMAERSGEVVDFFWSGSSGGASTIEGYLGHSEPLRKVTLSLDDFADQVGARPELLKIDVEGAESRVLAGARRLLVDARPTAMVELHGWSGTTLAENAGDVLSVLGEVGYRMVYLRTRETVDDPAVLEGRGRCHVLALPRDEPLPPALDGVETSAL